MSFSPDCSKLLSCSDDCSFKVFDSLSGLEVYTNTLKCPLKYVSIFFSIQLILNKYIIKDYFFYRNHFIILFGSFLILIQLF
jgi:WD40 repeat protein